MTFDEVILGIQKLIGLELSSIRPGANITLVGVDTEKACLFIRTSKGEVKSRPFSELRSIWNEMMKFPAVHVEGVLMGSGTSRNQPETILANLPYIEWLKIANKKHIAYVGKETHPFGTLRQMPSVAAAELASKLSADNVCKPISTIVVTATLPDSINTIRSICCGSITAISQGAYLLETGKGNVLVVASERTNVDEGTYVVLKNAGSRLFPIVSVADEQYYHIKENGIDALISV